MSGRNGYILIATVLVVAVLAWFGLRGNSASGTPTQAVFTIAESPIKRCMNMGNALEAPSEGEWGYTIRASDLALIRNAGFDTVRVPIKWSARAKIAPPYTIDGLFEARVDTVVNQALARGLNVIINVHHYDELNDDPATHLPRLYAIWDQLFLHFADAPEGVIFEFLNEPHSEMGPAEIDEMNRYLLTRARVLHPDRWIIVPGANWGHMEGLEDTSPPYDSRVITTFHFYNPFEFTHQGATWTKPQRPVGVDWGSAADREAVVKTFDRAVAFREKTGMPIFLGEFGAYKAADLQARARWTRFVRASAEARDIGWCHWDWATGFPVYDQALEDWIAPMRDALITPPPPIRSPGRGPRP